MSHSRNEITQAGTARMMTGIEIVSRTQWFKRHDVVIQIFKGACDLRQDDSNMKPKTLTPWLRTSLQGSGHPFCAASMFWATFRAKVEGKLIIMQRCTAVFLPLSVVVWLPESSSPEDQEGDTSCLYSIRADFDAPCGSSLSRPVQSTCERCCCQ